MIPAIPAVMAAPLLALLLAACGNRGALYLPDETPVEPVRAEAEADSPQDEVGDDESSDDEGDG